MIMGCDWHPRYQIVVWVEEETGEVVKRRLEHGNGEAERFYGSLPRGAIVGMEATFPSQWFERLLGECGHQLWVGDSAKIRAHEVRRQKTDRRDAENILDLLLRGRFPRIWVPSMESRDLRQLLVHRMKMVRTRAAAAGSDLQAGEPPDALAAGGVGTDGGTPGSRVASHLSTIEIPAAERGGESGHCPAAGRSFVLDAARAG